VREAGNSSLRGHWGLKEDNLKCQVFKSRNVKGILLHGPERSIFLHNIRENSLFEEGESIRKPLASRSRDKRRPKRGDLDRFETIEGGSLGGGGGGGGQGKIGGSYTRKVHSGCRGKYGKDLISRLR